MKKKFLISLLMVLVLCFFPLFLTGCGEITHSLDDFDNLYAQVKTNEITKQYFDGDNLTVNFSGNIQTSNRDDKSYIFGAAYSYYLKSSSRLFSGIIKNQPKPSFVLRNFKAEEVTDLYNKFENVKNELVKFDESKTVYEKTEGHIYYKNFISSYNNLINSLYNFNTTFANAYFSSVGKADFSTVALSDRNIKDFLAYQLMQASKISFNYELKPFKITNPLGEVHTYIDNSTQLKNFITLANSVLNRIDSSRDVTPSGTNASNLVGIFTSIQVNTSKYNNECDKFTKALQNFNAKAYQSSTNKQTYIEDCEAIERSSFNIIQNFLEGRYKALTQALTQAVTYITF